MSNFDGGWSTPRSSHRKWTGLPGCLRRGSGPPHCRPVHRAGELLGRSGPALPGSLPRCSTRPEAPVAQTNPPRCRSLSGRSSRDPVPPLHGQGVVLINERLIPGPDRGFELCDCAIPRPPARRSNDVFAFATVVRGTDTSRIGKKKSNDQRLPPRRRQARAPVQWRAREMPIVQRRKFGWPRSSGPRGRPQTTGLLPASSVVRHRSIQGSIMPRLLVQPRQ